MLLSVKDVCKSFGSFEILKDINLSVEEKGRYGLIGINGAGKSTLLSIIMGTLDYDSGDIYVKNNINIGFLKQNNALDVNNSIYDEMRTVFVSVINTEKRMRELEIKLSSMADQNSQEYKIVSAEYAKTQDIFESKNGYNIDVKIKTVLNGMGFADKDLKMNIKALSGGEKTRLAIAKLLLEEPDLLILDEPTNHLDFKTLEWLESYLNGYVGAILIVSHDRYFLDNVVEHIFELERGMATEYTGNYSKYLILKEEQRVRLEKEYEIQQVQIAQMQTYIDKNMARASTSASAKSREKALERMDIIEKPDGDLKKMQLSFKKIKDPYKDVLTVNHLDICVGKEKTVLCSNVNIEIKRGEKVAIIGENGIGKSSFLKTIQDLIPHYNGDITWGKNVTISYYDQENLNLNYDKIALDELWDRFPSTSETEIRKVLGNVLLAKDDVYKPIKVISGGERAKLAFCILMLEKSNVLVMDEPTNHLDLVSKEVLERALSEYEGTLIFVSHDRYLLNKVPDRIIEIKKDGVRTYDGAFDDYKKRVAFETERDTKKKTENSVNTDKTEEKPKYRSKQQRKQDVQGKLKLKELETTIAETEEKIADLEKELTDENIYSNYVLMNGKCAEMETLKADLEKYYEQWMELDS